MIQVHGTTVALDGLAVLLRGEPGSGKSDLALRLIDGGARLVADDQTRLELEDGRLIASCPGSIAGLIEVRGVGILPVASLERAPLGLVADLVSEEAVERLPEPAACDFLGVAVPLVRLAPYAASAAAKLRLVVSAIRQGIIPRS
ncbi:MAG: HPr kinase/phosphatase C-terminal domain-containing protein [Alphaproteobacteria bacterium]|jgi:serine kinase of HPr protein (carbohydrate metabolism regulator)